MVGVIDYGMGNHSSVKHTLLRMGHRVLVSDNREVLDETDLLLLPGVGAFPKAMEQLHTRNLVHYIQQKSEEGVPVIGICLGMQLLLSESFEKGQTVGMALIPGRVVPFNDQGFHIGWNTIHCGEASGWIDQIEEASFYFNHSHICDCEQEHIRCEATKGEKFPAVIKKGKTVGVQFHPEKSQQAGERLLKRLIEEII